MTTYCEDCDNVHPDSRKKAPYYWTCIEFPNVEGGGFVLRGGRVNEPYMYCKGINGGVCPVFTPKKGN
jgi:hypothetical protein